MISNMLKTDRHIASDFPVKIVDLHNHVHLKGYMLERTLSKRKFLGKLFRDSFWPLSQRSTIPLLRDNINVTLATTYVLEKEWLNDVPLIKFLSKFSPLFRKRILNPSPYEACIGMMDFLEKEISKEVGIKIARNPIELFENQEKGISSVVHSVEGGHSLVSSEYSITECLNKLSEKGCAYLTLAHFYNNPLTKSCVFPYPEPERKTIKNYVSLRRTWDERYGLTELGKRIAKQMLEIGMIIDVSHLTPKGRQDVYNIVDDYDKDCSVIASHVGVQALHRLPYNLSDDELKWFAKRKCTVGVIFMNYWLSPHKPEGSGLHHVESTLNHIINVAGEEVPAIGTDFDGFTDPPDEIAYVEDLPWIVRYLEGMGYHNSTINKIMYSNAMRILENGWKN